MARADKTDLQGVPPLDLVYAIERLVAAGKTTRGEVLHLAGERADRIQALERELASLRSGATTKPTAKPKAKPVQGKAKPGAAKVPAATDTGAQVLVRKDGRRFTRTAKVAAARKLQGQYLGRLRKVSDTEKDKFKAIAHEKGVAAAVAALDKRLGGR